MSHLGSNEEACCFFVNIFHTLLAHAILVYCPPKRHETDEFWNTISYDLFRVNFTLSELYHCVLRGPPVPGVSAAVSRQEFACAEVLDPKRALFALQGPIGPAYPQVMTPGRVDQLLDAAAERYLKNHMRWNAAQVILLPKSLKPLAAEFETEVGLLEYLFRYVEDDLPAERALRVRWVAFPVPTARHGRQGPSRTGGAGPGPLRSATQGPQRVLRA